MQRRRYGNCRRVGEPPVAVSQILMEVLVSCISTATGGMPTSVVFWHCRSAAMAAGTAHFFYAYWIDRPSVVANRGETAVSATTER
jgi:hypothetical protein